MKWERSTVQLDEIDAKQYTEEVEGFIDCYNCDYSGMMKGYIPYDDPKYILFVCEKCQGIERVINYEAL